MRHECNSHCEIVITLQLNACMEDASQGEKTVYLQKETEVAEAESYLKIRRKEKQGNKVLFCVFKLLRYVHIEGK